MKAISVVWVNRIFLLYAVFMAVMNSVSAMPANPMPFLVVQPDGTSFQAVMRGDEFQGWMETADGYTIVTNPATKFYEYATPGSASELTPSGHRVSPDAQSKIKAQGLTLQKGLRPPRHTALEKYQADFLNAARVARASNGSQMAPAVTGTWALTPVTGPKKILLILVGFQDASLSTGAAAYWGNVVNASTGSVAKYYQDNSFGNITVSPVTTTQSGSPNGVVTVSLAQNHPNCGASCSISTESAWINSALAAAAPYVNFASLDTNGDGTISVDETLIYFILAGYEAAAGGGFLPSIWAHAWGGSGVGVAGKSVNHWALNGERYDVTHLMTMGGITHEMGHAMGGLPDLYDTEGHNSGLGAFSLMSNGSWGRKSGELGGATPVNLDAWSRQYLGWSTPQYPSDGAVVTFASPLSNASAPLMMMNPASSTSEYWLVENRPPVAWDAGLYYALGSSWTGGLLIQHIDANVGSQAANTFNTYVDSSSHQGNVVEEPSTSACHLLSSTASHGCPTILFYSGNATTFNDTSTPNSKYYSGAASNLGVSNISAPGSTMTATFHCSGGALLKDWNLLGNGNSGSINVTAVFDDNSVFDTIWKWEPDANNANNSKWGFFTPNGDKGNGVTITDHGAAYALQKGYVPLTTIDAGEGFWVKAKTATTVPMPTGTAISSSSFANLPSDWRLISVGDNPTAAQFNVLLSATPPAQGTVPLNVISMWAWDATLKNWYFYDPDRDAKGTLADYIVSKQYLNFATSNKTLAPGVGFWVRRP